MARSQSAWSVLPRQFRRFPSDLTLVLAMVVATNVAVLVPIVRETPLRAVCSVAFVLFVPGYAFTAVMFPGRAENPGTDSPESSSSGNRAGTERTGITGLERFVLSLGASIIVVPLVALVLNFSPWGINLLPLLICLSALTVAMTAAAAIRRQALPAEERFHVPIRKRLSSVGVARFRPDSRTDAILGGLLVLALVLAVSSAAYTVATPAQDESYSEFYLLTESEDGELVADGYPENFTTSESASLVVGVRNHEHRPQRYTVVVELQRTTLSDDEMRVNEAETLGRYQTGRLSDTETWQRTHQVTPTLTGDRLRLTYLLYRGDPPADPTVENAYRELYLWVNVTES